MNNNKNKIILGVVLYILGLIGILSLLTLEIDYPEEVLNILESRFTPFQIKLLSLVNPIIMLTVAVPVGIVLFEKVGLKIPVISSFVSKVSIPKKSFYSILTYSFLAGLLFSLLLILFEFSLYPLVEKELSQINSKTQPNLIVKILYGGITEELLMRLGLMTFFVWLSYKVQRNLNNTSYWIGILFSSILFAFGHFPIVFSPIAEPSSLLLTIIFTGNFMGGLIFGWLYWEKGLESAMIAHILAHLLTSLFM